jgi:hypothetical protein
MVRLRLHEHAADHTERRSQGDQVFDAEIAMNGHKIARRPTATIFADAPQMLMGVDDHRASS